MLPLIEDTSKAVTNCFAVFAQISFARALALLVAVHYMKEALVVLADYQDSFVVNNP